MFSCCFSGGANPPQRSRRRARIPEAFLAPQGLYPTDLLDLGKLRRFIKDGRLAPCYKGLEDARNDEEVSAGVSITPLAGRPASCAPCSLCLSLFLVLRHCDAPQECPICFLYYEMLNTSKCCGKRVCTECFLQARLLAHTPRQRLRLTLRLWITR